MISEALRDNAINILCRLENPRNETERIKRDWARAITERNESKPSRAGRNTASTWNNAALLKLSYCALQVD